MRKAFSLIELVFVIAILGILSSIAVYKFSVGRDDSQIAKAKIEIANIRSGILFKKNQNLLKNESGDIYPDLEPDGSDGSLLFGEVLSVPIKAGKWVKESQNTYIYTLKSGMWAKFRYDKTNGNFECVDSGNVDVCAMLGEN